MGEEWIKKQVILTEAIEREFLALGIPLPKDRDWWDNDTDNYGGSFHGMEHVIQHWLTDIGVAGARKLQAERRRLEEQKRADIEWQRRAVQWKLTVAGTIIGWVIAILSLVIAIIALRNK